MQKQRVWQQVKALLLAAVIVCGNVQAVGAVTSSSPNYKITETEFGATSSAESCNGQYCSRATIGNMAVGQSANSTNSAEFGSLTPDQPQLEVIVEPGVSNLGLLSTEQTATKTTSVKILSYLSNGYVLQVIGDPPKYGGHTLDAMSSLGAATPGTEQFGINLVANTSPSVGANLVQVPSAETSFGEVATGYNTPNQFRYISGATVARSLKATGRTDYTISTIVNIANNTPAGHYSGDFAAVVIPVY